MRVRHALNPLIFGVRLNSLFFIYRYRLRSHKVQELLAGGGIAVGVALVFGVLITSTSLTQSAKQLVRGTIGSARLQLVARSSHGFDSGLAEAAARLPGVAITAPLLRENAMIVGPRGRRAIELVGVTPSIVLLGGALTRDLSTGALLIGEGIGLPSGLAAAVGAEPRQPVTVLASGDAHPIVVRAVLDGSTIGAVAGSDIAVTLLPVAQRVTEQPGRVTTLLIKPRPGADRIVARELERLAAGQADVVPADNELRLLDQTAGPINQSTTIFAAISAMVGFLLALNAVLLTAPERRRFIAELRTNGYHRRQVFLILGFQTAILGVGASLIGLIVGGVLARVLAHQAPVYLAVAFPVGTEQAIQPEAIVLALAAGILAAFLASLPPLWGLWRGRGAGVIRHDQDESGQRIEPRTVRGLSFLGALLVLIATGLALLAPSLTIGGGVMLAVAVICLVPLIFVIVVRILKPACGRIRGSMLSLAVVELEATATRSIALIAVAALAVYGSVAIQGARHDLLNGLDEAVVEYLDTADIWVAPDNNFLTVSSLRAGSTPAALAQVPGVASVRSYQGGLLDVGPRRLWIRARSPQDSPMIQASQLLHGNLAHATQLLRQGGWMAISNGFASEHHLTVGDSYTLPTPSGPARLGVAAITTNVGWSPGAITINTNDYRRHWQITDPTALEVNLAPGVTPAQGKRSVEQALAGRPGLLVETATEREGVFKATAREGLKSLGQISTLLLITAALAVAAALSAAIWQRRARLAALKAQGFSRMQLWRSLVLESAVVLAIGCTDGAILGLYGQALAGRWLQLTTGFPAPFSLGLPEVLGALGIVAGVTLLVVALPGLSAARVPPRVGFQE